MKSIVGLFFTINLWATYAHAINYYRCDKTEDCAKAYVGCGRYGSVHKRYKELYEAKARKGDTMAFCHPTTPKDHEMNEKGQPICRKNKCRLIYSKNDDSV